MGVGRWEEGASPPPGLGAREFAAQILEAIRLGVVPAADLSVYTVGRAEEVALVERDLDEVAARGGAVRALLGDYGTGKTHMLELIQRRALSRGFLVARAVLDARETAPSHPRRVYRALARSLRYPDRPFEEGVGLSRLLEMGASSPSALARFGAGRRGASSVGDDEGEAPQAHLYLTPALRIMGRLMDPKVGGALSPLALRESRELLMGWIEGHPTISNQSIDAELARGVGRQGRIYSLMDYRPWARIYAYLISGIAALARSVGFGGLVVLLDEAEFYALLSGENKAHAQRQFKALTLASVGAEGDVLPFDAEELDLGGYGVLRSLPAGFDAAAGLYTVLAMTPHGEGMSALSAAVPSRCVRELAPLGRAHYEALAAQVCEVYGRAHPGWEAPPGIALALARVIAGLIGVGYVGNPRQAVKFIVEFLDVARTHPGEVVRVVRDLQASLAF